MSDILTTFKERLFGDWLPAFCEAPHRNYSSNGFKKISIDKLHEFDAYWFMRAIDSQLVSQSDGFFMAPKSAAKEQIFWQGSKAVTPRPVTLWIEPIITIGALSRLNEQFNWPKESLGAQSVTWAFDLVCYEIGSEREVVACEVKKSIKEIENLIRLMNIYCCQGELKAEPQNSTERNAYRKVQGVRLSWPKLFWALGPNNKGHLFLVSRKGTSQLFDLIPINEKELEFQNA